MAKVLRAVEATFDTDFAIVNAQQDGRFADAGGFAGTAVGAVGGRSGRKFARVLLGAELWDGRPPHASDWDDADELPFAVAAGAGPLVLGGFESTDVGLDLGQPGAVRVQVLARGRQRYGYSSGDWFDLDGLPPEEWRLRIFPVDAEGDPFGGEPRRLSGGAPFGPLPASGVGDALRAWDRAGWGTYLLQSVGAQEILLALQTSSGRASTAALAAEAVRLQGTSGPFELSEVGGDALDSVIRGSWNAEDRLSALSSRAPARTIRELLDAFVASGLLLRSPTPDGERLLPNPDPDPVWERVRLTSDQLQAVRLGIGRGEFEFLAVDILNRVRWAAGGESTVSVRRIATRLAVAPFSVVEAIEHLVRTERIAADRPVAQAQDVADPVLDKPYRLTARPAANE